MQMFDTVVLDGAPRLTADGYLVTDARIARTGIQVYLGSELGRPEMKTVRIYRPESEVFAEDAMASFAYRPVTDNHPKENVTSKTWKRVTVGMTSGDVVRDGGFLRVPMMLADADTIEAVRAGKREISAGYEAEIVWKAGITDSGEEYDASLSDIRGNHVAIVTKGRAGAECRIGDEATQTQGDHSMEFKTVILDGVSIQVAEDSVAAVTALATQVKDAKASVDAKDGEIAGLRASLATVVADKDAEIATLKTKIPDAAAMDVAIAERSKLIDAARKVIGDSFDPAGKSLSEIQRAVVCHKLGDKACDGKSDEYVVAVFDTVTALAVETGGSRDPVRDAIRNPVRDAGTGDPHKEYRDFLANAWKSPVADKE